MQKDYDEMLEDMKDPDKVYEEFMNNGYYTVDISLKFKSKLKKLFLQNDRKLKLRNKMYNDFLSKQLYFAYVFWVDIILDIFSPHDKEFLVVQYFSEFFWHQIESLKGEDVDDSTIRVTFYPRT